MAIEQFTLDQFTEFLQSTGLPGGVIYDRGEHVGVLEVDGQADIWIRSSISETGIADAVGQDSIRLFLVDKHGKLLYKGDYAYVTRVVGWRTRLQQKIDEILDLRKRAGDCRDCGKPKNIFISHSDKNSNRLFFKCMHCGTGFMWADNALGKAFFSTASQAMSKEQAPLPLEEEKAIVPTKDQLLDSLEGDTTLADKLMAVDTPAVDLMDILDADDEQFERQQSLAVMPQAATPTPEQESIINAPVEGAYRVIAGPGSGKTFTMKLRYRYLLDHGVPADKILAVAFNSKMASELLEKISALCPEIQGTAAESQISTIHAFCLRIGKQYGLFPNNVQVADGQNQWKLRKLYETVLKDEFPDEESRPLWAETAGWIDTAKHHGITQNETVAFFLNGGMSVFYAEKCAHVREKVDRQMKIENLMTFTDMVYYVDMAIRFDPQFVRFLQSKFSHIILDEGQDTFQQAMRILTSITDNFMIVGDPDQLLYRFAGATPEANLFDGFEEKYPDGQLFKLECNHRSTPDIVVASRMIRNNYLSLGGPYDDKYFKQLFAAKTSKGSIGFYEFKNPMEEADFVAQKILKMAEKTGSLSDVAGQVFCGMRTRAYSVYIEDALARENIPYINTIGVSFWSLSHINILVSYLKCLVYPDNADAFKKVYNIPSSEWTFPWRSSPQYGEYIASRILSKEFISLYPTYRAVMKESSNYFSHCQQKYRPGLVDIFDLMSQAYEELQHQQGTSRALRYFVNNSLKAWIEAEYGQTESSEGDGGKLDDYYAVIEIADMFPNAQEFLAYVDNIIAAALANVNGDWTGRVVLSTIHKLKGLEREYVFALGVSEFDPSNMKSFTSLLPHTFAFVSPPSQGKLPAGGICRMEDERCLYFVLITRARSSITVCSPRSYRGVSLIPSRFVDETLAVLATLEDDPHV